MVLRARTEPSPQRAKYCGWSGTSSRLLYSRLRKPLSGAFIGSVASLPRLSPQTHRFLSRAIGEREQHGLAFRLQLERHPGRRDESVLGLEIEALAGDAGTAFALGHRIHRSLGRAVGLRPEAFGQQLQEGGDGRHGMAAGERIDELELPAMAGIGILV